MKQQWNNAICSNKDGSRDYHTKWPITDRERQILQPIYGIWKKKRCKWTYIQNRNRPADIENKHGYQSERGGGRIN